VERVKYKKFLVIFISLFSLQISLFPLQAVAAEDPRAKLERVTSFIDKSNRLIDSLNVTLESSDAIMADVEDAIDLKLFDFVQSLSSRTADVRRKIDTDGETLLTFSAAHVSECAKLDIGPTNTDLYFAVEDSCLEFADSNLAAQDAKRAADSDFSILELRLAELSTAAAQAKAAADAKKSTPKPSPKAVVKKAAPKKITCKKGAITRVFNGVKCPPGYTKK
jgi:hypothetical protein